ncbi:hypothetical protein [Micromonospora endolithica]|uniref:Uncharacterized protein n=1 Tax=Micromonospora endolithica TaxID=230091 RepID=A0A3A9YQ71_9ACTN|nr:hypothetical protein [Micromonospora endolithica]RKN38261.1 hypothetical protein D7223_31475 [Micromonospora endolithica]TWJ25185.1 two-component system sensor histidine kinase DesK [Micromonospora endolithica]
MVFAAVVLLYTDARTCWHLAVLAPEAAAAVVAFERWAANDLARVALPCLHVGQRCGHWGPGDQ